MRSWLTALALIQTAACVWSGDDSVETRSIPVYVTDYHFEPLPDCLVMASAGKRVIDSDQTDVNGIAVLDVVDDELLTIECQPEPDLVHHHTVQVLASDESVSVRFRLTALIPKPTFDVAVEITTPGSSDVTVGSDRGYGCAPLTAPPDDPIVLEIDPVRCMRQRNGKFSVWGVQSRSVGYRTGSVRDLDLGTTSVVLVLTTDHGTDVTINMSGDPTFWYADAAAIWEGGYIGRYAYLSGFPTATSMTFDVLSMESADAVSMSAGWGIGGGSFGTFRHAPVGTTELAVDATVHTQTLTSAFGVATASGVIARWSAADDGVADYVSAVARWTDRSSREHVWLIETQAETGDVEIRIPLDDESSPVSSEIPLTVFYRELDYVDGYQASRSRPSRPRYFMGRSSLTVTQPAPLLNFPPD